MKNRSRRHVILLRGWLWAQLPLKVRFYGPDRRDFCVHRAEAPSDWPHFDLEPDVRELLLVPVQFDRVAMWSDPLEQLGVATAQTVDPVFSSGGWTHHRRRPTRGLSVRSA